MTITITTMVISILFSALFSFLFSRNRTLILRERIKSILKIYNEAASVNQRHPKKITIETELGDKQFNFWYVRKSYWFWIGWNNLYKFLDQHHANSSMVNPMNLYGGLHLRKRPAPSCDVTRRGFYIKTNISFKIKNEILIEPWNFVYDMAENKFIILKTERYNENNPITKEKFEIAKSETQKDSPFSKKEVKHFKKIAKFSKKTNYKWFKWRKTNHQLRIASLVLIIKPKK